MADETNKVTLTTQELLKLIDHDKAFKSSNWMEWLADRESKRKHQRAIIAWGCITVIALSGLFILATYFKIIQTQFVTGILGVLIGAAASLFKDEVKKAASKATTDN